MQGHYDEGIGAARLAVSPAGESPVKEARNWLRRLIGRIRRHWPNPHNHPRRWPLRPRRGDERLTAAMAPSP